MSSSSWRGWDRKRVPAQRDVEERLEGYDRSSDGVDGCTLAGVGARDSEPSNRRRRG